MKKPPKPASGVTSAEGAPREVLFAFFRELLALNDYAMAAVAAAQKLGRELDLEDYLARRAAIRERYCTPRTRKTDRVASYGPLEKTAYDAANIVVEGETRPAKNRANITVHNHALGEHWRYALVLREGRWLIDHLQFRDGRKWKPVPLH